jgi:hypothetical protein
MTPIPRAIPTARGAWPVSCPPWGAGHVKTRAHVSGARNCPRRHPPGGGGLSETPRSLRETVRRAAGVLPDS